jgi:hypothetical protein
MRPCLTSSEFAPLVAHGRLLRGKPLFLTGERVPAEAPRVRRRLPSDDLEQAGQREFAKPVNCLPIDARLLPVPRPSAKGKGSPRTG